MYSFKENQNVYEEHISSVFRVRSKPSKKLPLAGSKLSHLAWHISGQIFHAQFTQLATRFWRSLAWLTLWSLRQKWTAPQKRDCDCTEYNKALNILDTWQRVLLRVRGYFYDRWTSSAWLQFPRSVILIYWVGVRPQNFKILVLNFRDLFQYWLQWTCLILMWLS
jgi:hypothetical protein